MPPLDFTHTLLISQAQVLGETPTGSTKLLESLRKVAKTTTSRSVGSLPIPEGVSMAYRVIAVQRKTPGPVFKVLFEWWEAGARLYRAIPRQDWPRIGFRESMTLTEAKLHKDGLNAKERLSRAEKRRQRSLARRQKELTEQQAYFPEYLAIEFEKDKLPQSPKSASHWKKARDVMAAVALPPEQWLDHKERFYKEFIKDKMSPSYVKKVLPLINLWGAYSARKAKAFFEPLPYPPRSWANTLAETHYSKEEVQGGRESDPLTPEMLVKAQMPSEYLRWLAFTVWFGLRPIEVDLLSRPSSKRTWWIEDGNVLAVYQTKLKGVAPEDRVKRIPAFLPEQQALLAPAPLRRPGRKAMISAFGESVTLYGGRKNFVALMRSKGQRFENVSVWLGHTDLDRTYKSYFNKREVKFDPVT